MVELSLPALVPSNPCAYLAGLGLLRLLSDSQAFKKVQLSWIEKDGVTRATLHGEDLTSLEDLCDLLASRHHCDWLPSTGKDIRNLKPEGWSEAGCHAWIARPDHLFENGELMTTEWRTYTIKERVGWLDAIRGSAAYMDEVEKWREALEGPWRQEDAISPLGLEPSSSQETATQGDDTSTVGLMGTAGAVWLAVCALPLFPLMPGRKEPITSGIRKESHQFEFNYVTWDQPLPLSIVRHLCTAPWHRVDLEPYRAYGIATRWRSEISLTSTGRRQLNLAYVA